MQQNVASDQGLHCLPNIYIATDKVLFSSKKCLYLSYFSMKTFVVGTHSKRLAEALLMSTHNICFCGEIRKILCGYLLLTVAMNSNRFLGASLSIFFSFWMSMIWSLGVLIFRVIIVLFEVSNIVENIVVKYQPNKAFG